MPASLWIATYLLCGLSVAAKDLQAHPVDQPGWARRPTLGMFLLVILLWWVKSLMDVPWRKGRRVTVAISAIIGVAVTYGVSLLLLWGWYAVAGLLIESHAWRLTAALVVDIFTTPFLVPILTLATMFVLSFVMRPLHWVLPSNVD